MRDLRPDLDLLRRLGDGDLLLGGDLRLGDGDLRLLGDGDRPPNLLLGGDLLGGDLDLRLGGDLERRRGGLRRLG